MIQFGVSFLALLNPFALFVYLNPVAKDLSRQDFFKLLVKAGSLSLGIFLAAAWFGESFFKALLFIDFASFRVFGGVVIVVYALIFIIQGRRSFFILKGNIDDLAAEVALPFMVGAATISMCIIIGTNLSLPKAAGVVALTMFTHVGLVFLLYIFKYAFLKKRWRVAFDKVMGMLLRLNGFIVGAIGSNLIFSGIKEFFLS